MMTLDEFIASWLMHSEMAPPKDAYEAVAGNVGVTLYRDSRFQVQIWACPPNSQIADHTHPHTDGWAVRVAGDIQFRKHGKPIGRGDMKIVTWNGMRTPMIRVACNESHGVVIGPAGGSFLSVTERLDGHVPGSVHMDWAGAPLDAAHATELDAA
jgi:hypothetical protein